MKVTLQFPIQLPNGSYVHAVVVRRPLPEELEKLRQAVQQGARLVDVRLDAYSLFTSLDPEVIDQLDFADLAQIDEALNTLIATRII